MIKVLLCVIALTTTLLCDAQNVGIGNEKPSEKLDVTGNVNIDGQIKFNGNAGNANQVLMKDASNNPIWGDMFAYKNIVVFDCNSVATSAGASNCTGMWTVPDSVSTIIVECWGAGGGGSYFHQ